MSQGQGNEPAPVGKQGAEKRSSGAVAAHRRALVAFGALFLVLFLVIAISEGVGDPSVPSGDVALVDGAPGEVGEVTQAEFDHALKLAAAQSGEKSAPKPGEAKYEELKEAALNSLFEGIWLQGLAAEEGIEVGEQELAAERRKLTKESFQTNKEFQAFLKESGYTSEDIDEQVKIQILSTKLQAQLTEGAPKPTQSEIEAYYEAAKATQFTQKPSRDVRMIVNKERKKANEAREALVKDNTAKNWQRVARKYSEDPATKESGGLQKGVTEELLEEPLGAVVFDAPESQVEGPIEAPRGYTVFEVTSSTPESAQELKDVEAQIKSTLEQQAEQEYFANYVSRFASTWGQRTFCAEGYVTERCSEYRGNGHSATAPEGCYEADPEGGLPEACPAPVHQLIPALPGTVTPLEPKGTPVAQRPRPAKSEEAAPSAGIEGSSPPTGE